MSTDVSFRIADLQAFHVSLSDQPGYWETFQQDQSSQASPRFEFRPGWQTVYPTTVESILVRILLTDGTVGWGEANCPIGPEVAALIAESFLLPMARDREFSGALELWDFLYDAQRGRGYAAGYYLDAMAALDIAVWDALGMREQLPVAQLLTDAPRQRLPVYLSGLRQATRKDRVETLKKWLDSGLTGVKIFLNGDVDEGCEELAALQSAAPETEQWMADTLWMCDPDGARRAKTQLADQGVRFLECPLQPEDLRGHRELVAAPGVAIALGEHFRTHYQTEVWFESPRGLDIFQLDVGRTGLSDGLRQIEQATSAGVASTPHMGNGLAVFQAATLHFAAACDGQYLQEYQAGLAERGASIGSTDWQYDEGAFVVPDTPGLGIQIDEEAVSRYSSR